MSNEQLQRDMQAVEAYLSEGFAHDENDAYAAWQRIKPRLTQAPPAAAGPDDVARDAARYRWLRDGNAYFPEEEGITGGELLDAAIDAARKGGACRGSFLRRAEGGRVMRYVLHPGHVASRGDGQKHFIGGPQLAFLYGVNIRDPRVVFGDVPGYREQPGDIHLRPRSDGRYSLAERAKEDRNE